MIQRSLLWLGVTLGLVLVLSIILVVLDLVNVRRVVPLSDHYDWLAFVGAVLGGVVGGLLTFGGVYLTLRQQRQSDLARAEADQVRDRQQMQAEDLRNRLSIMPIFEYSLSYDPSDFDNSAGQLANEPGMPNYALDGAKAGDSSALEFLYDLKVQNVGLGHGIVTTVRLDIRDNHDLPVETNENGFTNFLVKANSRRDIRYYFYAPRNPSRFDADPRQFVYSIVVTLTYRDLLDNEYQQVLRTSIAKGLLPNEDPTTGGQPYSSFQFAEPPTLIERS